MFANCFGVFELDVGNYAPRYENPRLKKDVKLIKNPNIEVFGGVGLFSKSSHKRRKEPK